MIRTWVLATFCTSSDFRFLWLLSTAPSQGLSSSHTLDALKTHTEVHTSTQTLQLKNRSELPYLLPSVPYQISDFSPFCLHLLVKCYPATIPLMPKKHIRRYIQGLTSTQTLWLKKRSELPYRLPSVPHQISDFSSLCLQLLGNAIQQPYP